MFSCSYILNTPLLPGPDPPMGIFNSHNMISRSDYEEETQFASTIRSTFITEERRQICYDQVIYDDERLELMESAGLRLVPADPDSIIPIEVEPYYEDSVFFIIDDDGIIYILTNVLFQVCTHVHAQQEDNFSGDIIISIYHTYSVTFLQRLW